jgi:hypothetical protein
MGVQLSALLQPKTVEFKELNGKRIAINANNVANLRKVDAA